jgi:Secretion system C-terminal sorting domain
LKHIFTTIILLVSFFKATSQACFIITDSVISNTCDGGTGAIYTTTSAPNIVIDGNLTEAAWAAAIVTNTGGAVPGFGAGHELNALYANASNSTLYLGIAGNVQDNNRILIFIDSKTGGYNNGSFGRAAASYGLQAGQFNSGITFDAGFNADYCFTIGTNAAHNNYYYDLFTLNATGTINYYLGDNNTQTNYKSNPANNSATQGFELAIPWDSLGGRPLDSIKVFVMYQSDNGFLSNQFLSKANVGEMNYGNNAVDFNAAAPNPITLGVVKYNWSNGTHNTFVNNLAAGTYTLSITDAKNCTVSNSYTFVPSTNTIALATLNNATSGPAGTDCDNSIIADGAIKTMYTFNCNAICQIANDTNTVALGNTTACVTVFGTILLRGSQPYVARVYDITSPVFDGGKVTLYYTDYDFAFYNQYRGTFDSIATHAGGNTTATVAVTQYTSVSGTQLTHVVGPVTALWNNTALRWEVTFTPIVTNGTYYLHTMNPNNAPLSIDDIILKANYFNDAFILNWASTSNFEYKNFEIWESDNGNDFKKYQTVANNTTHFQFPKTALLNNFYKILGNTIIGKQIWSNTISTNKFNDMALHIYPIPVQEKLQIELQSIKSTEATVYVTNILGLVVLQENKYLQKGSNNWTLNTTQLLKGIYVLKIITSTGQVTTKQFVKN